MKIRFFFLTTLLALLLGCDKTGPTDPDPIIPTTITHGVTGTVTFTGQWPAKADEIRLVTSKVFPPQMSDIMYGVSIPVDSLTYDYEFELDPGTYKIFGVAWRSEGAAWNYPSFCGTYYSKEDDDSLAPSYITIADDKSVVSRVNIGVNRSKAHVVSNAKITGTVAFNGTWPGNVTEARVIATTKLDITTLETPSFNDLAFSNTIAKGATTYNYEIPAFPGNFLATFVIFFKANEKLSIADVLYSNDHGGLDMANKYTVELDKTVNGPNFTITF
jgi:hypothetical protein